MTVMYTSTHTNTKTGSTCFTIALVIMVGGNGGNVRYNIYNDGGGDIIYIMTVEI